MFQCLLDAIQLLFPVCTCVCSSGGRAGHCHWQWSAAEGREGGQTQQQVPAQPRPGGPPEPRPPGECCTGEGRGEGSAGGSLCDTLHHVTHQVDTREEVSDLLSLEGKIDLVIPRGGQDLVRNVMTMANGKIPVLGHTEGVCHVYIDQHADIEKMLRIGECGSVGEADSHHENIPLSLSLSLSLPRTHSCLQWWTPSVATQLPAMPWSHCWCTPPSSMAQRSVTSPPHSSNTM